MDLLTVMWATWLLNIAIIIFSFTKTFEKIVHKIIKWFKDK